MNYGLLRRFNLFSFRDLFQTLAYFEKLVQDLDRICCLPMTLGLEEIMQFVVDYQKLKPDLFARARLQVFYDSGDEERGSSSLFVHPFLVFEFFFFFNTSVLLRFNNFTSSRLCHYLP